MKSLYSTHYGTCNSMLWLHTVCTYTSTEQGTCKKYALTMHSTYIYKQRLWYLLCTLWLWTVCMTQTMVPVTVCSDYAQYVCAQAQSVVLVSVCSGLRTVCMYTSTDYSLCNCMPWLRTVCMYTSTNYCTCNLCSALCTQAIWTRTLSLSLSKYADNN